MILAAFDSNLLFYIIAAIIGLISWLTKRGEHTPNDSSPSPKFPRPAQPQQPEDERLRKFLEALGVPADERPAAPIQRRQPPLLPKQSPTAAPRPLIVPPLPRRMTESRPAPPPVPKPVEKAVPLRKTRSLEEEPALVLFEEKIRLPDLTTAVLPEFITKSSTVSAIPFETAAGISHEADAYLGTHGAAENRAAARVEALLRTPADLRAAIILREILGRPPGLQSPGTLPTFP